MSEVDIDLTKVILDSRKAAFKNNNIYTGQLNISGTYVSGYQQLDYAVVLDEAPDMVGAVFNGPGDAGGIDARPSNAWFKEGYVYVLGNNAGAGYTDYPVPYRVTFLMSGITTAIIRLTSVSQIAPTLTLTSTNFSYRIVDYSVL